MKSVGRVFDIWEPTRVGWPMAHCPRKFGSGGGGEVVCVLSLGFATGGRLDYWNIDQ